MKIHLESQKETWAKGCYENPRTVNPICFYICLNRHTKLETEPKQTLTHWCCAALCGCPRLGNDETWKGKKTGVIIIKFLITVLCLYSIFQNIVTKWTLQAANVQNNSNRDNREIKQMKSMKTWKSRMDIRANASCFARVTIIVTFIEKMSNTFWEHHISRLVGIKCFW